MRALSTGTKLEDVLDVVRSCGTAVPIVLFTYYNPVYRYGIVRFAAEAAAAGAAGAIVPDLSLEESDELRRALLDRGLAMPLLVAPSTPRERAASIAAASSGFVYLVSRLGVTGTTREPDFSTLRRQVDMLREVTDRPLAVGFGIGKRDHVAAVRDIVDGFVVGSAVIDAYGSAKGEEASGKVQRFCKDLLS
jgi:tryptophan synthase alpha chain